MKKFEEEENEDFCEEEYFNFEDLIFGEEKNIWKNFCGRTINRFLESFLKILKKWYVTQVKHRRIIRKPKKVTKLVRFSQEILQQGISQQLPS